MGNIFKQKWFQILLGWLISSSIVNWIFRKQREQQQKEEEALMKKVDDIFDKANSDLTQFPEFHVVEF